MIDWKSCRGKGPWPFEPANKHMYNEGIRHAPDFENKWTQVKQRVGEAKITPVHNPHCGYWPKGENTSEGSELPEVPYWQQSIAVGENGIYAVGALGVGEQGDHYYVLSLHNSSTEEMIYYYPFFIGDYYNSGNPGATLLYQSGSYSKVMYFNFYSDDNGYDSLIFFSIDSNGNHIQTTLFTSTDDDYLKDHVHYNYAVYDRGNIYVLAQIQNYSTSDVSNYIYVSSNGGSTFNRFLIYTHDTTSDSYQPLECDSNGNLYTTETIGSYTRIFMSSDGGENWSELLSFPSISVVYDYSIDISNDIIYFGYIHYTGGKRYAKIISSDDYGSTWSSPSSITNGVDLYYSGIYIASNDNVVVALIHKYGTYDTYLVRSNDYGVTWSTLHHMWFGDSDIPNYNPGASNYVVIESHGSTFMLTMCDAYDTSTGELSALLSTDNGENWSITHIGLTADI